MEFKQHRSAELTLSCAHINPNEKEAGAASISDKADFRTKDIIRDKERHFIIKRDQFFKRLANPKGLYNQ